MVNKLTKFLRKVERGRREKIFETLLDVTSGKLSGYDIKKLKGVENHYRLRKGQLRIIFEHRGKYVDVKKVDYRDYRIYDSL